MPKTSQKCGKRERGQRDPTYHAVVRRLVPPKMRLRNLSILPKSWRHEQGLPSVLAEALKSAVESSHITKDCLIVEPFGLCAVY